MSKRRFWKPSRTIGSKRRRGGARRRCPARGFGAAVGKKKNHPNFAVLRHLPLTKIVFDAVLMLYDLAGVCVKYKTASSYILLSCIEG